VLSMLAVTDVTNACVRAAVDGDWPDLEDALLYESAHRGRRSHRDPQPH
jgi:hypothetical protein